MREVVGSNPTVSTTTLPLGGVFFIFIHRETFFVKIVIL